MTNSLWRNAATLLLAVRNSTPSNSAKYDYKLLMMKRSRKSKFMPSAVVFPGGVTEKSDFCPTWKQLLEPVKPLKRLMLQGVPRPMIMSAFPGLLEPDIGFRINAIREMFEETGILLHLATEDDVRADELKEWRPRVHKDASLFQTMCKQLNVVPDVWSLSEWSDWLTPTNMKEQGRFDTLFYIGFSSGLPQDQAVKDNAEVSAVMWSDPDQLLDQNRKEELWLAPPQVYELSRLKNFSKYDDLKNFSEVRSQRGLITWMPYIIPVADGAVSIYPQDELYPEHPDYEGKTKNQFCQLKSLLTDELSAQCTSKNRMEVRSMFDNRLDVNVKDCQGHLKPLVQTLKSNL